MCAWDGKPGHINPARFATSAAAHNRQPPSFDPEDQEHAAFDIQQPQPESPSAVQPGQVQHYAHLHPLSYEELQDAR